MFGDSIRQQFKNIKKQANSRGTWTHISQKSFKDIIVQVPKIWMHLLKSYRRLTKQMKNLVVQAAQAFLKWQKSTVAVKWFHLGMTSMNSFMLTNVIYRIMKTQDVSVEIAAADSEEETS